MVVSRHGRAPRATRFALPNGLNVILAPSEASPTVSVWVWYRVGSKNEWPGVTGASHWVEHMLFQGSPRYRKGAIDRAVVGVGGHLNAFTDYDFTAYFSTVPREHLAVPLDVESDRMTRALLVPAEVERERTVVRSEREGNDNWPEFRVDEELGELSFRRHPYRWDPLGYPEDILALTPAELKSYYRRFYGTRNAVLVVSGGFDPAAVARRIRRTFGRLPEGGDDPTVRIVEPEPNRERRARLSGPGTTAYVQIGYRAPPMPDPTTPAVILLDVLLGGETRLFSVGRGWGPPSEHPSSRLYRALVDQGLAVRATSQYRPRVHPGLFTIQVLAAPSIRPERVEEAIDHETERLSRSGPGTGELRDARDKLRRGAELAYEGASGTGFRLGYFAMFGGPRLERELLDRLLRTDAETIRSTARSLFRPERRAVVIYEPTGGGRNG